MSGRVPTDRSTLNNATLLPASRKPPLTPVLYFGCHRYFGRPLSPVARAWSRTPRRCVCSDAWGLFFEKHRASLDTVDIWAGVGMDYKKFIIQAFERGPDKWRAKIFRYTGKPLTTGRKRIMQFVTGVDATTASAALLRAVEAIDAEAFSRPATSPEKFWRRRGQRSNARPIDGRPAQRASRNKTRSRK